jgi:hypothetical protein
MNDIKIITPPDKLYDKAFNIMLMYPNNLIKDDLQQILAESLTDVNIYLYDLGKDDHAPDWLLSTFAISDVVIANLDDFENEIVALTSYFISFPKTFWLTNQENLYYNKISVNRVYSLDFLKNKLTQTENK